MATAVKAARMAAAMAEWVAAAAVAVEAAAMAG